MVHKEKDSGAIGTRVAGLLLGTVVLVAGYTPLWAEDCTWFNSTATVCIFDLNGEECTTTWYTDVLCTGGTIGGPGYLPYYPSGGGGGGGPIGYPLGDGSPTPSQQFKLNQGINKALQEIEDNPDCAGLPQTMGLGDWVDLAEQINKTTYRNWSSHDKCGGSARAFTTTNWDYVYLCASFADVTAKKAAEIVIHEALHSSGLSENPPNSNAPTSSEIDAKVQQHCSGL